MNITKDISKNLNKCHIMIVNPEEGYAVSSLAEAKAHNDKIKSFEYANSHCHQLKWFINIFKDSCVYIDEHKEYIKGSKKYLEREIARTKKNNAEQILLNLSHKIEKVTDYKWIEKHSFYTEEEDYDGYSYEKNNTCYLRLGMDPDFSNCYVDTEIFIDEAIIQIKYLNKQIMAYELADRLNIRYNDLKQLFDIDKIEYWTAGLFDNETRYNDERYTDTGILLLLEQYQNAKILKYIKDDEVVDYPKYTCYADFLKDPLPIYSKLK